MIRIELSQWCFRGSTNDRASLELVRRLGYHDTYPCLRAGNTANEREGLRLVSRFAIQAELWSQQETRESRDLSTSSERYRLRRDFPVNARCDHHDSIHAIINETSDIYDSHLSVLIRDSN